MKSINIPLFLFCHFLTLHLIANDQFDETIYPKIKKMMTKKIPIQYPSHNKENLSIQDMLKRNQTIFPIKIIDGHIKEDLEINNQDINHILLSRSKFYKKINIHDSRINGVMKSELNEYLDTFSIKYNHMKAGAILYRNLFHKHVDVSFSKFFESPLIFEDNQFNETVSFYHTFFSDRTSFDQSTFQDKLDFSHSDFSKETTFRYCIFKKDVNLSAASFHDTLSFEGSEFHENINFKYSLLPHHINMSNVIIHKGSIDFRKSMPTNFNKAILINVRNTDIDKLLFNYNQFHLWFTKNTPREERIYIYTKLLKKYQNKGMIDSYEKLKIEYERYKLLSQERHLSNLIQKHWWNYGLNKERVFTWFLLFMLVLTCINGFFYNLFVSKFFTIHFLKKVTPNPATKVNYLLQYLYNLPRAALLTFFFCFATFLLMLVSETKVFKTDNFIVNAYVILINATGYVFILFFIDSLLN